ncbi:hypothetical protein NOJ05_19530 [Neorhizobium galegae]|uniref:hypothetical protein n=1 Tax=Neorhizobium galegae TaxID=399 RepID=UPI002107539C|nr:hypothetical protein [Neorhizobium galegae]MCQ1779404.1 hypothetical protein [Neorhizobium galegae]MCQ1795564.1 hypothetical protein [Neorhizobium galegae]
MIIGQPRQAEVSSHSQVFHPLYTVYCSGIPKFRSQLARDAACLLDVDETVESWSCQPMSFSDGSDVHLPDFAVERDDGQTYVVDIAGQLPIPSWIAQAVQLRGLRYQLWTEQDIPPIKLRNARDLLRYARFETSLADRLAVLIALKEAGSLRLSDIINMASGTKAVPIISAMILHRQITIDLDEQLIGPDSVIRCSEY